MTAMTFAEKILKNHSTNKKIQAGDVVEANIDCAMSHDNTTLVHDAFSQLGISHVWNPEKIVIVLDHRCPANSEQTAKRHHRIDRL